MSTSRHDRYSSPVTLSASIKTWARRMCVCVCGWHQRLFILSYYVCIVSYMDFTSTCTFCYIWNFLSTHKDFFYILSTIKCMHSVNRCRLYLNTVLCVDVMSITVGVMEIMRPCLRIRVWRHKCRWGNLCTEYEWTCILSYDAKVSIFATYLNKWRACGREKKGGEKRNR